MCDKSQTILSVISVLDRIGRFANLNIPASLSYFAATASDSHPQDAPRAKWGSGGSVTVSAFDFTLHLHFYIDFVYFFSDLPFFHVLFMHSSK